MNRGFIRALCMLYRAFCALFHPVSIYGRERVPLSGPVILCANHISMQDPMILDAYLGREVRFMAKRELYKNRLLAKIMQMLGAFPVSRGDSDISAVRAALAILSEGGALGIFPEGHRSKGGEMKKAENGVSLIALRSGAPVVPIYIAGDYKAFRRIRVYVGERVDLGDLGRKIDVTSMREATSRVSAALRALAPHC